MDLSVIIVCHKGWERLAKCLDSLASFSGKGFSMEVIVVDNNSGDGKIDEFEKRYPLFRFIRNPVNGGFANGCNIGASESKADNLLFLNPDTVVKESEIGMLLHKLTGNHNFYIISCRQIREDGTESKAAGRFPGSALSGKVRVDTDGNALFPDWVSGSVMMLRKEIFKELNGFDEDFWMYSEDVDLCKRARNRGGEIAFYTGITIEHNHGGSSRTDLVTTSVTKCEVQISRHLYLHKHLTGLKKTINQVSLVADNLITGIITGFFGLVFFFIPELFVRFLIAGRILKYYVSAIYRRSWLSPRSVNYNILKPENKFR